jgi:hypothetical protein
MAARSTLTVTSGTTITSAWGNSVRDHVVPFTGSNDVASEGQLAVNTTADKLVVWNGSAVVELASYGSWGTFTSTVTQAGGPGVATADECEWTRTGRHVVGGGRLTITSIISAAANPIQLGTSGLPAVSGTLGTHNVGTFIYQDTGTRLYQGSLYMTSAGVMTMATTDQVALLGQAPSFAAAATDIIWLNLNYRASTAT